MAGYSKRSLVEKLGIKPSTRVVVLSAPPTYASLLGALPAGSSLRSKLPAASGFIHKFGPDVVGVEICSEGGESWEAERQGSRV